MGCHALYENMSYGRTCLQVDISYKWMSFTGICLTGGQVLVEGMSCRRACLTGGCVLQKDTSYWRVYFIERYVLRA